jgi:hypothetical protein
MTPEDHNRLLAWGHIVHASLFGLMGLGFGMMFAFIGVATALEPNARDPFPSAFFGFMGIVMGAVYLAMALPSLVAGIGLLKRKSWAKLWAIIAAVFSASSFPIGTAVCVYTFWFMFSDPGKALYDKDRAGYQPRPAGLYGQPAGWEYDPREAKTREYVYTPPPQPPNWRSDD